MSGDRFSSIPRIYATSITTPTFRWLHEEGWDPAQKAAFAALRTAPPTALYASPALVKKAKSTLPAVIGRWLLTPPVLAATRQQTDSTSYAAAEAQLQATQFNRLTLLLSAHRRGQGWSEGPAKSELTLLISALILLTQADRVRLIPLAPPLGAQLQALGLGGSATELWAPLTSLASLCGKTEALRIQSLDLNPADWWQQPFAAADRATLSYLEKRLEGLNKKASIAAGAKPRRRGWSLFPRRD